MDKVKNLIGMHKTEVDFSQIQIHFQRECRDLPFVSLEITFNLSRGIKRRGQTSRYKLDRNEKGYSKENCIMFPTVQPWEIKPIHL